MAEEEEAGRAGQGKGKKDRRGAGGRSNREEGVVGGAIICV